MASHVKLNNPAGRLYHVLQTAQAQTNVQSARHGWATVFECDPNDLRTLFLRAAEVMDLGRQTLSSVRHLEDDDPDMVLMYFREVEASLENFAQMSSMQMVQFLSPIKETGWHCLQLSSSLLSRRSPQPLIEPETYHSLVDRTQELIERVIESDDLDVDTKQFLLRHLHEILRALRDQPFFGVGPIEDAVDRLSGAAQRQPLRIVQLANSQVATAFVNVINAIGSALSIAAATVTLALPPGGQPAQAQPPSPPPPPPVVIQIIEQSGGVIELPSSDTPNPSVEAEPPAPQPVR